MPSKSVRGTRSGLVLGAVTLLHLLMLWIWLGPLIKIDAEPEPEPAALSVAMIPQPERPAPQPRPTQRRQASENPPERSPLPSPTEGPAPGGASSVGAPSPPRAPQDLLPKAGHLAMEAYWGEYALGARPLGRGQLDIAFPSEDRYTLSLTARAVGWAAIFVPGTVSFQSEGRLTSAGLVPEVFRQVTPRRGLVESRFDSTSATAQLEPSQPKVDLPQGFQDRLSVVFQLAWVGESQVGGLLAGQRFEVALAGRKEVRTLVFTVEDREELVLPGGILVSAIRIASDPFEFARQGQIQVWLDPSDRHFPARILYKEPSGRALDFLAIRSPS
ncbi:MAG: DUF3108 domain-containing protein [Betaproteobacteria bacterium]|nr:DUF3108 domain-containing protein [Betaproteobacteria bacterium]NBY14243.1 DUF3108 domain-containing protein [Betaproteobacteria bacterium]NCA15682.1 DUF3108 domain-containing protein [Betaproteobacteria bacterium]